MKFILKKKVTVTQLDDLCRGSLGVFTAPDMINYQLQAKNFAQEAFVPVYGNLFFERPSGVIQYRSLTHNYSSYLAPERRVLAAIKRLHLWQIEK